MSEQAKFKVNHYVIYTHVAGIKYLYFREVSEVIEFSEKSVNEHNYKDIYYREIYLC